MMWLPSRSITLGQAEVTGAEAAGGGEVMLAVDALSGARG